VLPMCPVRSVTYVSGRSAPNASVAARVRLHALQERPISTASAPFQYCLTRETQSQHARIVSLLAVSTCCPKRR
jgi:hypothetical protein